MLGLFTLQRSLAAARLPALHGAVFPGRRGDRFALQALVAGAWKTVMRSHLGAGATFTTRVPGPGSYRIVYAGLNGPSVRVG
jgi:hypothetical protein